jgi:protein PhnA
MSDLPACPQCGSNLTYEDGGMFVCPECAHEWARTAAAEPEEQKRVVRDSVGNVLNDGDAVTVIKDLKVKGSSLVVKMGTKVKNIRLVEGDHDIDCKIDGIGAMQLKSEFVRRRRRDLRQENRRCGRPSLRQAKRSSAQAAGLLADEARLASLVLRSERARPARDVRLSSASVALL